MFILRSHLCLGQSKALAKLIYVVWLFIVNILEVFLREDFLF
jgi:hypothetical protein